MQVCVINGSPKGNYSITLQTALYIQESFPDCSFDVLHAGQRIRAYEKDMSWAAALEKADMLLFCYPVYTFLAPYQLHRFIELIKEKGIDLRGKFAAQLTTSKHFFDMTAHRYIEENCRDMGLTYLGGLSADMDDLLEKTGREQALAFWRYTLFCAEHGLHEPSAPVRVAAAAPYTAVLQKADKKPGFETVVVTNCAPDDGSLAAMIADFDAAYPYPVKVVNIAAYPFAGGCLGCFRCASDGTCVYQDGFDRFLREEIQTAAAIVYAFSVRDHSMGASFKLFDDRQFCNGHRTVTAGMPEGYLVHGDYANETNLQTVIEGRSEVGGNFLAGVATDAAGIARLSARLCYALENGLCPPRNFYGVGGMKIFRDLIYLMQGLMRADHQFYKKHGIYDFPQKRMGAVLKMKLLGGLIANPRVRKRMGNRMNEGMVAPYQKARKEGARER